ncbi:MAG: hypothetical protein JWN03_6449 [Nocardia sp.]|nr:hypothetical protein [Nocardia sp.]
MSRGGNGNTTPASFSEAATKEDTMNKSVCIDCWRRDNLTFVQRLDPAFYRPGPVHRCAMHRALHDDPSTGTGTIRKAA